MQDEIATAHSVFIGHVHQRLKNVLVFPWPDPLTSKIGPAHSLAACPRPASILTLHIVPSGVLLIEFGRFHAVVWEGDEVEVKTMDGLGMVLSSSKCFIVDRSVFLRIHQQKTCCHHK